MTQDRWTFETLWGAQARAAADVLAQHAFQSESWVEAVGVARGRPHRFVAVRVLGGEFAGACLFGGVHRRFGVEVFESMPMAGYGGWCFSHFVDQQREAALTHTWLQRASWWVVSLTAAPGRAAALPTFRASHCLGARWRGRLDDPGLSTHILSLVGDDETLLRRARPKARNHLRRVDRADYAIDLGGDRAIDEFCRLFRAGSVNWRASTGRVMPDKFFERLYEGGQADIWLVNQHGRYIAAAFFIKGRTEVFYQASGTLREPGDVSAGDALLWTAIRHYRDLGFLTLNMGASDGLETVRFFKEKLGALASGYRRVTYFLPKLFQSSPGNPLR